MLDPSRYGPVIAKLLAEERVNELGPGSPNHQAAEDLRALNIENAFAAGVRDRDMANACLAGLWLYHDYLDQSHRISQTVATPTGSFWHAIMHRREPDASNSNYWWHRVGRHPVFPELCEAARVLAGSAQELTETRFLREQRDWDPYRFVDLCEAARTGASSSDSLCRRIQAAEWRLLFDYCYRHAYLAPSAT